MVMLEKVADWGFLAFWPFENEWKFRKSVKLPQKIWNLIKSEYYPPRQHWAARYCILFVLPPPLISNTSTTTGTSPIKPRNIWTYHYHTSYYADHQFPIINTNHFVIHHCEFYLCLNWTVLFICFMTEHENGTMFTNHNQLRTPQKKLQKITAVHFQFLVTWKKYSIIFNGIRPVKR